MKTRKIIMAASLLLFFASLVPMQAWAAAARTKVIVVVPHRVLFTVALPVYIAQEKGFYRDNNLDVDAVFTRGGGENVQAVVSGDAQIGLGTGTLAVMSAFVKKAPIKIAAAEITGMDTFWYVNANTNIRRLEDLAGKRVAYSRPGASSHMAALAIGDMVKAKGVKPSEAVSIGGIPENYTAVRTGQTDAGWSVAPFQLDRIEKGELRVVVRGDEIASMRDLTAACISSTVSSPRKIPRSCAAFSARSSARWITCSIKKRTPRRFGFAAPSSSFPNRRCSRLGTITTERR